MEAFYSIVEGTVKFLVNQAEAQNKGLDFDARLLRQGAPMNKPAEANTSAKL